jgi:hypothetical protein
MLTVPASLTQAFDSQLSQRNIPNHQRRDFHKWLRFYLDYCAKYASDPKLTASFAGFDEKLKSKDQSEAQRKQARRSIGIYYRMIGVIKSTQADSGNPATKNAAPLAASVTPHQEISKQADLPAAKREMPQSTVTDQPLKLTGANWEWVYESLQAAIKPGRVGTLFVPTRI